MSFTLKKQTVISPGKIEKKENINLEDAIGEFQNFRWDEQLKISKNSNLGLSPTIRFINEKQHSLEIIKTNPDAFMLFYENTTHFAQLTISNDANLNIEGVYVEDYISWFFNNEFELNVKLEEIVNNDIESIDQPQNIQEPEVFEFNIRENINFGYVVVALGWFIFHILLILFFIFKKMDFKNNMEAIILLQIILVYIWGRGFYIYYTFLKANANAFLKIRIKEELIEYSDDKGVIQIRPKDIDFCHLHYSSDISSGLRNLMIRLKDKRTVWITCLLANPDFILKKLELNYETKKCLFPSVYKIYNQPNL